MNDAWMPFDEAKKREEDRHIRESVMFKLAAKYGGFLNVPREEYIAEVNKERKAAQQKDNETKTT